MATTIEGAALTMRHREQQLALRAVLIRQVITIWPAFDITNIDDSWQRIEPLLVKIMEQGRNASSALSKLYYEAFRVAENIPGGAPQTSRLVENWIRAAVISLRITGPVTAKRALLANRKDAADQALVSLTGSLSRHSLDGGRERISRMLGADGQAIGFARVASGKACAFCAMLASRGPVYRTDFPFKSHDHCSCTIEPVYFRDQEWPQNSREYRNLWNSSTQGTGGHESVTAFRRALEKRP